MNFFRRDDSRNIVSQTADEEGGGLLSFLTPEIQIVIAFAATLIVGFICGMSFLPRFRPPAEVPATATPVVDTSVPTAREAYEVALALAQESDAQAAIMSGAGLWTPVIDSNLLAAGRTGWTFYFFLPQRGEMATVVVDRGGSARMAETQPWDTPPQLVGVERWRTDSPEAMTRVFAQCGDTLNNVPDATVEVRLNMAAEARTALWQVKVTSQEEPLTACEVAIDATTGLIP